LKLENEKKELFLQKELQLRALSYEYEKRQALAKSDKERQQLYFEEKLKRQKIESVFNEKQVAMDTEQQRKINQAKAVQDKKDALSEAELKRQKNLVTASFIGGGLLLIVALIASFAYRQKQKDNRIIAAEKQRSENLLLNTLPSEVAEKLKQKGASAARQYDEVSVLFTDFVDFTGSAEKLSPHALVNELNECFTAFDAIVEQNGLEKIKTIGDAYLAVCGLPVGDPQHGRKTVQAALEFSEFINERRKSENGFEIRIGINSGPVVAGIVGVKKFAYDIWGDTVNTAARMEQHSEAGRVNISKTTYELVKDDFTCYYRDKIPAKHKGKVEMYFVEAF